MTPEERLAEKRRELEDLRNRRRWWVPWAGAALIATGGYAAVAFTLKGLRYFELTQKSLPAPVWFLAIPSALLVLLIAALLTNPHLQRIQELHREIEELEEVLE